MGTERPARGPAERAKGGHGPILVQPVLDTKPWGARRLAGCGISLPEEGIFGEALLTAPESIVTAGSAAGETLGALAARAPAAWVGEQGLAVTGGHAIFPLLIKLIDANANLSIQVHPDDAAAAAANLGTGKTEAWHILAAEPGSVLYLGLGEGVTPDDFQRACQRGDGSAAGLLRQLAPEPGETYLVPAGTPHAIGAGVLLYEIQQPSNVTFRLDDWGRLDEAGQPRPLHHAEGFAALGASSRPDPIPPLPLADEPARRELLVTTRYFALEKAFLAHAETCALAKAGSPRAITCLRGEIHIASTGTTLPVAAGATAVVPAGESAVMAAMMASVVLIGWVPGPEPV